MIYLPWIAFLAAILWMIREGDKSKKEYLRRKAEQEIMQGQRVPGFVSFTTYGVYGQGQGPELGKVFGGAAPEIRTPEQERGSRWRQ